ncbi:MAG TPA: hypothetical protein VIG25_00575 [Pyrinomonadaceae bacterium]
MRISDFVFAELFVTAASALTSNTKTTNFYKHEIRNPHSEIRNRNLCNLWMFFVDVLKSKLPSVLGTRTAVAWESRFDQRSTSEVP